MGIFCPNRGKNRKKMKAPPSFYWYSSPDPGFVPLITIVLQWAGSWSNFFDMLGKTVDGQTEKQLRYSTKTMINTQDMNIIDIHCWCGFHLSTAPLVRLKLAHGIQVEAVLVSGDSWMYPDPNVRVYGKSLYKPYITWVFKGHNPAESLENTR